MENVRNAAGDTETLENRHHHFHHHYHCHHQHHHPEPEEENIILNPLFEDGLNNWSARGCTIILSDSVPQRKIRPRVGNFFAAAIWRSQTWNGIQQEITGRVQRKLLYEGTALVRIYGNVSSATVQLTLWVLNSNQREQYVGIANVQATDNDWIELKGKFLLNASPSRVIIYVEGPPPGTEILLNTLSVKHARRVPPSPPPIIKDPGYGVNIVANGDLRDGSTDGWFPLGNCKLNALQGSPRILPPMARDSLGRHEPLSGRYILVTGRTQTWMGPAQIITDKIKLFLTYQVSAWVKIGRASGAQNVNVALSVDNRWVNGGQVGITSDTWHEIGGSFRIEEQPSRVMVYVQGPAAGVDLMVAGLMIFSVDRRERFRHLKAQADKVRKRDVVLKFSGSDSCSLFPNIVKVRQTHNRFPLGTCINRTNMDNEDFVEFFVKNFNWTVFGNELKWYWTEPQRGSFNYKDADDMVDLCLGNDIKMRGHCIFWAVDATVQPWVKQLNRSELAAAVQARLKGLLTRYKGKFKHYDVNNEMLHGSFYQIRLGKSIRANMFKTAKELDPSATLFVNDYHVEDGQDPRSSPEEYIKLVVELQAQGAPVGGVGIQGHIDSPVGPIVRSALDKLAVLGLPLWFTELDVSSTNEHVRAEDLEVMLREAFAHEGVEGVMLWGFWELFMSRENAHLVNAEGEVNEAGLRLLQVKEDWLTEVHGFMEEERLFKFRGFHGTYVVEVLTPFNKFVNTFVVEEGLSPIVVEIDL